MKALVTGAGGFLGLYIAEQLVARGDQVRSFSRQRYAALDELGMDELGIEQIQGDLRDADQTAAACEKCEVVYHVAGVARVWGSWEFFHGINTIGTQNIVAGCRKHGVPKLVYTSSPSVTFDGTAQEGVDESVPYPDRWLCHYPHTKALAEQHVLRANDANLMTCSLRPHLIWGPRDEHLVPRVIDRARRGRLRRVGDGSNLVDMVYVENAATAHLQAADALQPGSPVCGRAYFISQGEPVNCWNWIDEILALAKLPPVRKSISYRAAWHVGALMETAYGLLSIKTEPLMTRFVAAQLATSHYFDISRARNDFGYDPKISSEEGMDRLSQFLTHMSPAT